MCCAAPCPVPRQQCGAVLWLVLVFMAVLAKMALSAVDAALLGTSLALNYRDHDRTFHTAEALLVALDSSLLARIRSEGLDVTLDTLPDAETGIVMSPTAIEQSGVAQLAYQAGDAGFALDFSTETDTPAVACSPLYQLLVRASGVRPGTQVALGLERQICCDHALACETGDFVSTRWHWRRLD